MSDLEIRNKAVAAYCDYLVYNGFIFTAIDLIEKVDNFYLLEILNSKLIMGKSAIKIAF
jgi:glutathione synthase/RimK-type ligase-like ATP-grasp enzyme